MTARARGIVLGGGLAAVAVLGACADVLGIRDDAPPPRFEHRAHVLEGVACTRCHQAMPAAGDVGPLHIPTDAECVSCHSPPHESRSCLGCHGSAHERERAQMARDTLRFRHDEHLLRSPGSCVRCHAGVGAREEDMIVPMARCLSCHEHRDEFRTRQCGGCHVDLPEEAVMPSDHLVHDEHFLRRHGAAAASASDLCATCHAESSCASCHGTTVPDLPSRIAFDRATASGMHRAGFLARHADEAAADPGLCTTCHQPSFCRDCHRERGVIPRTSALRDVAATRNPHPAGWVGPLAGDNTHGPAARRDPAGCASCHGGAGEALCAECHRVGGIGGSVHPPGFSSRRPLHDAPCVLCHGAMP